jgi:alanine-synthesizing transaminase
VTCVKPQAALYMFPKLDPAIYPIADDQQFFLELLQETKVMLVQGTGFNWPDARPLPHRVFAARRRPARGHWPRGQASWKQYRKRQRTA